MSYVFDVEKEHFLPATEYINSLPTVEYASSETLAQTMNAVSYTHLDVYKRQMLHPLQLLAEDDIS